eukprot:949750-Lingulodinium_polyedra.AAC.1
MRLARRTRTTLGAWIAPCAREIYWGPFYNVLNASPNFGHLSGPSWGRPARRGTIAGRRGASRGRRGTSWNCFGAVAGSRGTSRNRRGTSWKRRGT